MLTDFIRSCCLELMLYFSQRFLEQVEHRFLASLLPPIEY
jgi:hypothetical protein